MVKTKTIVTIEGTKYEVETTLSPLLTILGDYNKFKIQYFKKFNVCGTVYNKVFNSILRKYETEILVSDSKKYVLSLGSSKGIIARAALKRLSKDTEVKCSEIKVDLLKAIPLIIQNASEISINSGWFSNLGTSLRNAWLQGSEVNENPDWQKFVRTTGSELKNVELRIEDDYFDKGYILLSLSARGFIFTNSTVKDIKYIEIAEVLLTLIETAIVGNEEDEEDEEEIEIDEVDSIAEIV